MKHRGACVTRSETEEKRNRAAEKVKRDDTVSGAFNQTSLCFYAFLMLRGRLACVIYMHRGRRVRNKKGKNDKRLMISVCLSNINYCIH